MSERYTRLFSLPENLGLEDCPVVISAGALLMDNTTGKVLAQLKLRNLSSQSVKAVTVRINAYNTAGEALNGGEAFSYLDLDVPLDGEFGSQTPIPLPDAAMRSFTVDILSVVLADGTVYSPVESQATRTADGDVLKKIAALDKGRIALAKKAHWRQLFRLSFIPLLLALIAFGVQSYSLFFIYKLHSIKDLAGLVIDKSIIPMFIVPCICILASWNSKQLSKAPLVAFVVCLVCLIIQFLCALFVGRVYSNAFPSFHFYQKIWFLILRKCIKGSSIFAYHISLLNGYLYFPEDFMCLLAEILYFTKNISAAVIQYQHVKSVKRGTL